MKIRAHVHNPRKSEVNPEILGFVFRSGEEYSELHRNVRSRRKPQATRANVEKVAITPGLLDELREASHKLRDQQRAWVEFIVVEDDRDDSDDEIEWDDSDDDLASRFDRATAEVHRDNERLVGENARLAKENQRLSDKADQWKVHAEQHQQANEGLKQENEELRQRLAAAEAPPPAAESGEAPPPAPAG